MIKSFLRDGDQLMEQLTDFCPTTQGDEVVKNSVSEILHDVHKNGDEAVLSRTLLFDKAKLASGEIRVTQDELKKAKDELLPREKESILAVSYTHLTLPRYSLCRSRWSPYH